MFTLLYIITGFGFIPFFPVWRSTGKLLYVCVFPVHGLLIGCYYLKESLDAMTQKDREEMLAMIIGLAFLSPVLGYFVYAVVSKIWTDLP